MRGMSQRAIEETDLNLHFRAQKILALITLIANIGISVTGSIVRVTGSGLGCNTWLQHLAELSCGLPCPR